MVLVDGLAEGAAASDAADVRDGRDGRDGLVEAGAVLRGFMESLVDDALAGGEMADGVDREGVLLLLSAIGMGMSLASIGNHASFPAMLDVLERLNRGSLYREP
jgi:hypothetical protein